MSSYVCAAIFVIFVPSVLCECNDTYRIICETLPDVFRYDPDGWTDLQVGNNTQWSSTPNNVMNDSFMQRLRNLHSLTIINDIASIDLRLNYTGLDYLNLHSNKLEEINLGVFDHFPRLRKLILINNSIKRIINIHAGKFLRFLDLSNNSLVAIRSEAFVNSSIKWIAITHNQLSTVGYAAFPSGLLTLHLDHNNLEQLEEDVLENLSELEELSVSHNRLRLIPELKGLKAIKLLDFSFNRIAVVKDVFSDFSELKYLDFSHNQIVKFDSGRRLNLNNRSFRIKVSFAFNNLTQFDYYAVISFFGHPQLDNRTDNTVSVYGNPFHCRCIEYMKRYFFNYFVNETSCDRAHFSNGQMPICVQHDRQWVEGDYQEVDPDDFQVFREGYEGSKKLMTCDLTRTFYEDRHVLLKRDDNVLID